MSLGAVVRHELLVARRSRLAATVLVVGCVTPVVGALLGLPERWGDPAFRTVLLYAWLTVSAVLPALAVGATVGAVAGGRERGTLRVFAGLPVSRTTLFVAKTLARTALVVTATLVGLAGLVAVLWATLPAARIGVGRLAGFCLFTPLIVACYAALGAAVSGSVETRGRAGAVGAGLLVVTVAWPAVIDGLAGLLPVGPSTQQFLGTLSPFGAYAQAISDETAILGAAVDTPLLGTGVNATIICAWLLAAVVVGRRRFRASAL